MSGRIKFLIAALFLPLLPPLTQTANAAPVNGVGIVTSNLLMYYDYRNYNSYPGTGTTVVDASGNGYTGSLLNSPSYFHSASDSYLSFNGTSSQYQSVPSFTAEFSGGFSISFRADFGSVSNWERIIDFGNGNASSNILVARSGTTNDLWFETYGTSANNTALPLGNCKVVSGISNNTINNWTIVITANGATCLIYKDGVAQTVTFSGTDISPVDNVSRTANFIGRSNWSADSYFEGKIYNVAIYNRALSALEVTQNYNSMNDTAAPTISPTLLTSPENKVNVDTLTAGETAYFSLLSGGDSSKVAVASGGALTFITSPNYEAPIDSNTDNQYGFNVKVMDVNGNWTDTYIQITVTNVNENATLSAPTLSATPYKGIALTITVTPAGDGTAIPGKITYLMAGKRIVGCYKKSYSGTGNSTCLWEPTTMGYREITVTFTPTNTSFTTATAAKTFWIYKRTTTR